MTLIKEIITKPSQAVDAMIAGLRRQSRRKKFLIDMDTYGAYSVSRSMCFGCAATCALQEIAGKNFVDFFSIRDNALRLKYLGLEEHSDMWYNCFEKAIDELRKGDAERILEYFDVPYSLYHEILFSPEHLELSCLETHNWRERLGGYTRFSKFLKKLNL